MASMSHSDGWMWMNDGALFATYNDQGGARGKREFKSQNWFMTMAQHKLGPGQVTFKAMLSAEVWTQTERGYSQLFQKGEVYNGLENIDYQHPHDVFMQLAAAWRVPLGSKTGLTISGGPMGEATLGPAAFMHRQSASENPTAPLTHHFLDSGHVVQGVVALSLDRGPWIAEASLFHGAEPDQNRYGVTPGKLDSWAGRVWFRPSASLAAQVSYGLLKNPESLEPGDERRATASLSWARGSDARYLAVTAAAAHKRRRFDTNTTAFLSEATFHRPAGSLYSRVEVMQVTSEHLLFPTIIHTPHFGELIDWLSVATVGGVLNLNRRGPLEIGLGADATYYQVPTRLRSSRQTTLYGARPASFHVFLRIRPRAPSMGHMWNSVMSGLAMR
jgi:hypothetical protein